MEAKGRASGATIRSCFAALRQRCHECPGDAFFAPGTLLAMWTPTTTAEPEHLIEPALRDCTPVQREAFAARRVPFYAVPIHRLGAVESVLVVARFPQGQLYFEDVEEGFEFGNLGEDGAISDQGCRQNALQHVLSQPGCRRRRSRILRPQLRACR